MKQLILLLTIIITSTFSYAQDNKPYQFKDVGVNVELNKVITANLILTDEFDKQINLKDIVNNKPTIISFVYLNCPLLCHLMLDGLAQAIEDSKYKIGKDFQVISISIDNKETNKNLRNYKKKYHDQLDINNVGWIFLKGTKDQITNISEFFDINLNI